MPESLHSAVTRALRGVIDPETGRDLIAMGLVYDITITAGVARVTMTTTTRGCPLAEVLRQGAAAAVAATPGLTGAEVQLTWDPPWTPDRISDPA